MDNVTHSLIGITIAGALNRKKPETNLSAVVWTAVVASNCPDLDFVLRFFPAGQGLGYLLHHRGFTHTAFLLPLVALFATIVGGFVGTVLGGGGLAAFRALKRRDWAWLGVAGLLGAFFHVFADFWNSYGVHPFSPVSSRWYYGDFIFILEPFLWASMLPFAFFEAKRTAGKTVCALLAAGILTAAWVMPVTPWLVALALTIYMALFAVVQGRGAGVKLPISGLAAVLLAFALGSQLIRARVTEQITTHAPSEAATDLITSPAPGNPLCWQVIAVSMNPAQDLYLARVGVGSLLPEVVGPESCFRNLLGQGNAPLVASLLPEEPWMKWRGEFRASVSELRALAGTYCQLDGFLGFARAPYWVQTPAGLLAGDLRYDRGRGKSFSDRLMHPDDVCHPGWPEWEAPVFRNVTGFTLR